MERYSCSERLLLKLQTVYFRARNNAPSVYGEVRTPVMAVKRMFEKPALRSVKRWSPTGTAPPIHCAQTSALPAMP